LPVTSAIVARNFSRAPVLRGRAPHLNDTFGVIRFSVAE
jgi:hypothetical protein